MSKSLIVGGIWDRPFQLSAIQCRCPNLECSVPLVLPIGLSYALGLRDSLSETILLQIGRLCSEVGYFENYACASAYSMNVVGIITLIPV